MAQEKLNRADLLAILDKAGTSYMACSLVVAPIAVSNPLLPAQTLLPKPEWSEDPDEFREYLDPKFEQAIVDLIRRDYDSVKDAAQTLVTCSHLAAMHQWEGEGRKEEDRPVLGNVVMLLPDDMERKCMEAYGDWKTAVLAKFPDLAN